MEVISTRRYEARPPADSHASILVDPDNAVATVKEEEWETRKKKEITTTRQIETRVKRQVVLEDGEVVVDSGPLVTTNTTEDVEQQEHTTQERRTTGDEPQKVDWPAGAKAGALVQKELNETIVKSREEIEELLETEDRQQLGDISDEAYLQAVRNNRGDLRVALAESTRQLAGQQSTGPRVLQHTTRSNKVVDTEKTLERSELKQGGQIVTERKTTVEHEEIKDDELPESADEVDEVRKEATQRYVKKRDEDVVDYIQNGERIGREMRFVSETMEAERTGDWPTDSPNLRSSRLPKHGFASEPAPSQQPPTAAAAAAAAAAQSRKDALTRKPLDLEEEDEARKFETSKWLESHFGSESRSSHGSLDDEPLTTRHNGTTTSYINVTMKSSCGPRDAHHYRQTRSSNNTNGHSNSHHQAQQQQQHHHHETQSRQQHHETQRQQQQQQQHHETQRHTSRMNGRESSSPSGYFQGISEWSERYQSTTVEKQNTHHIRARSPQPYVMETNRESSRSNGHHSPIEKSHKETSYSRSYEATRRHQERYSPPHERPKNDPPSPPVRRKPREQIINTKTERSYQGSDHIDRASSPVHVVTRTWENRNRDVQHEDRRSRNGRSEHRQHHESTSSSRRHHSPERTRQRPRSPVSRSISPSPVRRDAKKDDRSRPSKSPSPSKYKIGESFRKLVGKLRSGSSERRNKRPGGSSTSQLTQTDDSSTYLQYNTVDRNVPLGPDYDGQNVDDARPPERPPRSPRNVTTSINVNVNSPSQRDNVGKLSSRENSKYRVTRSSSPRHEQFKETTTTTSATTTQQRNDQPIHRYYLGEDPYGGSIYGKEKGYRETSKLHSSRHRSRPIEEYSAESSSLGRFSKSTSRLAYEYNDHNEPKRHTSAQTLPRKIHTPATATVTAASQPHNHNSSTTTTTTRRLANGHTTRYSNGFSNGIHSSNNNGINGINNNNNSNNNSNNSNSVRDHGNQGQYGSMINISFKNTVTSPKTTHYVQTSINTQPPPPPPLKPERTYKSTLSRSKSFNVEIADDGVVTNPRTNGYNSSNVRSVSHLNKLDETPPLKSPGILASISRSNRDLMRNGRHDY